MHIDAALIKEQGVTFAVVAVKSHVLNNRSVAAEVVANFEKYFPGVPIVLMAEDSGRRVKYLGRSDLVRFLSRLHVSQLPWKRYAA